MNSKSDQLIGNKSLRESVINKVDVLEKVKKLEMLPGDIHVTVEMAATYYEVDHTIISMNISRNREELETDGMRVVRGEELTNLKLVSGINRKTPALTILPRRAVLRLGMLIQGSEVAEAVRSYLLDKEEETKEANDIALLSPEMQMFKHLFDGVARAQLETREIKKQLDVQTERVERVESTVTAIQEIMTARDDNWRKTVNGMVNSAVYRLKADHADIRNKSYEMLEDRAHCDLKNRLSRWKKRLTNQGYPKSKVDAITRMDVIESDDKLKEIYTAIVKELSISSLKVV